MKTLFRAIMPISFAALTAAFIALGQFQAKAQCSTMDCNVSWNLAIAPAYIMLDSGCFFYVNYKWRVCNFPNNVTRCEIVLDQICNLCCPEDVDPPTLGSSPNVVRQVADKMFKSFYHFTCPAATLIVVRYPNCWYLNTSTGCYEPCNTSPCCSISGTPGTSTPTYVTQSATCLSPCTNVCP